MNKEDFEGQTISISIQIFDRLKAIVLTTSGEIQFVSAAAGNLLDRYFDEEWLNVNRLPDLLKSWVEQQLAIVRSSEPMDVRHSWQITKNGRNLSIELLCDFPAEQHWLICCEYSIVEPTGSANAYSPVLDFQSIGLSKREAEILTLVAAGTTNLQISDQLNISVKTVKKHVEHIFRKLNANSRIDAVNKALRQLDRA